MMTNINKCKTNMRTVHTVSCRLLHYFMHIHPHSPIKLLHQTLAALLALVDARFHIIRYLELRSSHCNVTSDMKANSGIHLPARFLYFVYSSISEATCIDA